MKIRRYAQLLIFLSSVLVLSASFYFEWVKGLQPCPLCLMQRFCVILLVLCSMLMIVRNTWGRALFMIQSLIALAGVYFAGRQLWLQSLPPDQLPSCLPGMDVLIKYFPLRDVLHALFFGAADCGEVTWQWLGLSMPGWTLLYFIAVLLATLFIRFIPNRAL